MTVKVVDASAVAAICFVEPQSETVIEAIANADLVAPSLIDFELANICWKRARRHPDLAPKYRQQLAAWTKLRIDILAVPTDEVVALALATDLTAYDASYLWLARSFAAELVTLDQRLGRAANRSA